MSWRGPYAHSFGRQISRIRRTKKLCRYSELETMTIALVEMILVGVVLSYLILPFLEGQDSGHALKPKRKDTKNP